MSRLGGGIGTRGPGETKLETDRRRIANRIAKMKKELEKIGRHRKEQRKARLKTQLPVISLVGYTNAGKSSLMNVLTGSDIAIENQLFTTLDPTTRKIKLPDGRSSLLSDTVGFIRDMPEDIKTAFRATLEEIGMSNLILHVVDASCHDRDQKMRAVQEVLDELDVMETQIITVFNKSDLLPHAEKLAGGLLRRFAPSCVVSAETGDGIEDLLGEIVRSRKSRLLHLLLPLEEGKLRAKIHREGFVMSENFLADGVEVECEVPAYLRRVVEPYIREAVE